MDTTDYSDPDRRTQASGPTSPDPRSAPISDTASAPDEVGASLNRGLAFHWPRILLLWLLVTTPLVYMIYLLERPTFEAISLLRVEPIFIDLYDSGLRPPGSSNDVKPYMLTQILLISSDSVLDAALSKPAISNLPMIRSSTDPKALLRRELQVDIVAANTYLIRVMMSCADPNEGAAIVNSVVDAYMDQHGKYHAAADRSLRRAIETEIAKYDHRIADIQDRLMNPIRHGLIAQPPGLSGATKEDSESIRPSLSPNTEQQYARVADRILQADLDLIDAEVRLETARLPRSGASTERMREVETAVEEAKQRRNSYAKYLSQMKVATGSSDGESFPATVVKLELAGLTKIRDSLKLKLAQLEFEDGQEAYRISVQDKAAVPKVPAANNRSVYMAVTPVVVLLLIIGLALVQQMRAARSLQAPSRPITGGETLHP